MFAREQSYRRDRKTTGSANRAPQAAAATSGLAFNSVPPAAAGILQLQRMMGNQAVGRLLSGPATADVRRSSTDLPGGLRHRIERLSGVPMDDVRVHYNSPVPATVQAVAHAHGRDIHLGPGQEQSLPHEAWHVAQQKQGRVKSTGVMHGAKVNDDPGLEAEAEHMGSAASAVRSSRDRHAAGSMPLSETSQQPPVLQRKKAPATDYGEFETTRFIDADGRGVEIILQFTPDPAKVDAKKIALSQAIRSTTAAGVAYAIGPNQATKMVASGKSGAGYTIDTLEGANNPLYGQDNTLGATQDLKDTPASANKTADPVNLGVNTNYELGFCFKEKATDADKKKHPASLWDKPQVSKIKGVSKTFETTALAIDGADKGKYYGSVKWGYKMEGTDAAPTLTKNDIELASKGTPTSNFIEPAKLWNVGKTPGTIQVTADPEATVLKGDASATEKLAKGTKLKQLETNMWGTNPSIKAEVLKADGTGSGKIIYIKTADVKDMGDGSALKQLPT